MKYILFKPLISFLMIISALFFASSSFAQNERGHKGPISKKALLTQLKKIHDMEGEFVEGYIIKGDDLISIIEKTDVDIKINESIIKGGLDFRKLPKVTLDKVKFPEKWTENNKEKWRKKPEISKSFYQVTNNITITNSDIKSVGKKGGIFSVVASSTFFSGYTEFSSTTFNKQADFSNATFSKQADFSSATFKEEVFFKFATFGGYTNFSSATFKEASFNFATFYGHTNFSSAIFSKDAFFPSTAFSRPADFSSVKFIEKSDAFFSSATFGGYTNFSSAVFSKTASFYSAAFSEQANFSSVIFSGYTDFSSVFFSKDAFFSSANFTEEAESNFSSATFSGYTDFSSSTFKKKADFKNTEWHKLAYFKYAKFLEKLIFKNVWIKEYADFRNVVIGKLDCNSSESPSIIKGRMDFRNAIITEAHFQDLIFENDVYFSDTKFGVLFTKAKKAIMPATNQKPNKEKLKAESPHATVFRFVTFGSNVDFKRAEFSGNTSFQNINFFKDANFIGSSFKSRKNISNQKFSLSYLNFNNLLIEWDQLPGIECWINNPSDKIKSFIEITVDEKGQKLEPLSHVFKGLETNFRHRKQLDDANQAYYHKKRAELTETDKEKYQWLWASKQAEWIFWGILCGYGTKIWWITGWATFFNFLFAILYYAKGEIIRKPHPETKQEYVFKQRLFDFPKEYYAKSSPLIVNNKAVRKFVNTLRFSSVVLFKVGYRDTSVSGRVLGIDYKYIVYAEWALGYYVLAALLVTLSNTLPLINRLITGVF